MTTDGLTGAAARLAPGWSAVETRCFECCDTAFRLRAAGWRPARGLDAAERTARSLADRLNAFDDDSAVAELNRTGTVTDEQVAAVVRRGLEYREATGGAFDVTWGAFEHRLKAYLRGERDDRPSPADAAADVQVSGTTVETDGTVDLNGLAKGYVVDRAAAALSGPGRRGFVDGGGDLSSPTGPVAVESPWGGDPLAHLDTSWHVATSAGYRRTRGDVDHLYRPGGRAGGEHDSVTVVAERDCTEADALATTLATLRLDDAMALIEAWDGAAALVVHAGVFHRSPGFEAHVA